MQFCLNNSAVIYCLPSNKINECIDPKAKYFRLIISYTQIATNCGKCDTLLRKYVEYLGNYKRVMKGDGKKTLHIVE